MLENIQKSRVLMALLKNDFVLFGPIVRKLVFEHKTLSTLDTEEKAVRVCAYGNRFYRDILERDFDKYIDLVYDNPDLDSSRNCVSVRYILYCNKIKYHVKVYYFLSQSIHSVHYINDLQVFLDVNTVCLDRVKLSFLPILNVYKTKPFPFLEIVQNIQNKHYKILSPNNYLTQKEFDTLIKYNSKGWNNAERQVLRYSEMTASERQNMSLDKCGICKSAHNKTSLLLPCKHYFHYACVVEYITTFVQDRSVDKVLKCPYCTQALTIKHIM